MTATDPKPNPAGKSRLRRLGRWLAVAALVLAVLAVAVAVFFWTGAADRLARRTFVGELEKMTGGRVELKHFHFAPFSLRAELQNLTIHGRELEGSPPFFHADFLRVELRVDSLWRRKISVGDVEVVRPAVFVRVDAEGRSNVPSPKTATRPGPPLRERIFELVIQRLRLEDGFVLYNDVRVPLVAEGGELNFALDYSAGSGQPSYLGQLDWKQVKMVARRYLPARSDLALRFTLEPDRFTVHQFQWRLPHSHLDAEASLESFAKPRWNFRYRGFLDLDDLRLFLRKPHAPRGRVDYSGEGYWAGKDWNVRGQYAAREVSLNFEWFHTRGINSRGHYVAEKGELVVPDFEAHAAGGRVDGRVNLQFKGTKFRVTSRARGMSLAAILRSVNHPGFPVLALHWDADVSVDSTTTWAADFKHLDSEGVSTWAPPAELGEGLMAASASLRYHYSMDHDSVEIESGEISTADSRVRMHGVLGARDSALAVNFETRDLRPWNDFINSLRGEDAEPKVITGRAAWDGVLQGKLSSPTFTGHAQGIEAGYDRLHWDEVEGDMRYSAEEFRFTRARARRGNSSAQLDLTLTLTDWSFDPENPWSLDANLDGAATRDLQELLGWSYPVRGKLSGQFHGNGTRENPELSGLFNLTELEAWGWNLDHFRGRLELHHDEIRIVNAELRMLPPAPESKQPPGVVTGNFLYRPAEQTVAFDLTGAVIPLGGIRRLQSSQLPMGGQLSFHLEGEGPLLAPSGQGELRLVDFRAGKEVLGSFEGKIHSDGRRVKLEVGSAMPRDRLQGVLEMALGDDYPMEGDLSVKAIDLDPLIQAGLHLEALTGHSSVDGKFHLTGSMARPKEIAVAADLSRVMFDYEYVKLENVGPLRLRYSRDEVRVEQAQFRGPDSDFRLSGFARFSGDRPLELRVSGGINLRLLGGFVPGLEARGPAQVDASIDGTISQPRINGKLRVTNASANYGDFPAGLSRLNGEFVFDSNRLLFDNVTAETGGGQLQLGGSVTYGGGLAGLRYDLTARATRVRIRYPEGMSWLAGGTLRLSGTTQAGLLSGRVVVERVLMSQGFDLASLVNTSQQAVRAPSTSSTYLQNLQFDVEAVSSPDARLEWTGARFQTEAEMRVRGTWEHPILLGHIHLLNGEITFRGNRYRLTRGELNFSTPFRIDPELNVEATTTIRQYEVTMDFTGRVSELKLAYRSDPPLPSSDIIALLALGRTGEESELRGATAVQTPELGATTLLSEAISSQIGGRIERLFGISRFRVDPFLAGAGTEQNAAARITIEQQITRDLTITYITNVTSTQQQVIQVEYSVTRDISIVALRDQNGTFGLDVKFKKRFR